MDFPSRKLPNQALAGYVNDNLPLIENYLSSSVGARSVMALISDAAGYTMTYEVFKNALHRARKKRASAAIQSSLIPEQSTRDQTAGSAFVPTLAARTASTDPASLREIMEQKIDISQYPRTFKQKDT